MVQADTIPVVDPKMFFKPASWLAKIDFINHLILLNNVLITVLGEKGGGKTSFCTLLQSNLDKQIQCIHINLKPSSNKETIIKELATQLHLNHDENSDIPAIVAQINNSRTHVLFLIDDAHYLPESLINDAILAIKNQGNFGFFHLCLISDYSIVETLNDLVTGVYDNLVHSVELGLLDKNETRTYALQRAMVTRLINKPLTDSQFKQFYQLTKGNMAEINRNLEKFVQNCFLQKKKQSMAVLKKAGVVSSIGFIIAFSGIYIRQLNLDFFSNLKTSPERLTQVAPIVNPIEVVQPEKVLVSEIASWQDAPTRELISSALPEKQLAEKLEAQTSSNPMVLTDQTPDTPKGDLKKLVAEGLQISKEEIVQESKSIKISHPVSNKTVKATSTPLKLKKDSNLYTVQFAASHRKEDILRFQKSNSLLTHNAKLRNFTNEKGHWYVLILGEFNSRAQAQQSIKKLPTSLAKLNPWIRPIASLKYHGEQTA